MATQPPQTFSDLLAAAARFRDDRDWARFHTPKDLAAAVAIEASELQEIFLWSESDARVEEMTRHRVEEELADVLIHCANLALALDIDVPSALAAKFEANAAKYPIERARGKATKYTDL